RGRDPLKLDHPRGESIPSPPDFSPSGDRCRRSEVGGWRSTLGRLDGYGRLTQGVERHPVAVLGPRQTVRLHRVRSSRGKPFAQPPTSSLQPLAANPHHGRNRNEPESKPASGGCHDTTIGNRGGTRTLGGGAAAARA